MGEVAVKSEAFVTQMRASLKRGRSVETPFGQFFLVDYAAFCCLGLNTSARTMLQYLPSEDFLEAVLPRDHLSAALWRTELECDLEMRIPKPTEQLQTESLFREAVEELRGSGVAVFPRLGTFNVQDFVDESGMDSEVRLITFRAANDMTAFLNAELAAL